MAVSCITCSGPSSGESGVQTRAWDFGKAHSNIINWQRIIVKWETFLSPGNSEGWQLWE